MSMDELIRSHAKKILRQTDSRSEMEATIKRVYGFDYDKHFKKMLLQMIGLAGFEQLNRLADPVKIQLMSASLNSFKNFRDAEAHTYLKGTTRTIDAPSVTKGKLNPIYEGLIEIDKALKKFESRRK